jgi:hypothetical protein
LNVHIRHHKRRFDCSRCARYRPIHLEAEEAVEEGIRCGEFLHALFFGLPEEWEMEEDTSGTVYVKVPLDLIQRFQRALFVFVGNTKSLIDAGNRLAQLGDDLKCRIAAKEEDQQLEP